MADPDSFRRRLVGRLQRSAPGVDRRSSSRLRANLFNIEALV